MMDRIGRLIGVVLVFSWAVGAGACSCLEPPGPVEAAAAADLVFVGEVISIEPESEEIFAALVVEFDVAEVFEGTQARYRVLTGSDSAQCGVGFELGRSYLVYAGGSEGAYWSSSCDRTRVLERAEEDLTALRSRPSPPSLGIGEEGGELVFTAIGAGSRHFQLERSADFESWEPVTQFTAVSDSFVVETDVDRAALSGFFRLRELEAVQGVYGVTLMLPGPCLEDPDNPGECLNLPFPGTWSYDVREFDDAPDLGRENPIIATLRSEEDPQTVILSTDHVTTLDAMVVSEALRAALVLEGVDLSAEAEIMIRRIGRTWLLIDPVDQRVFFVELQEADLRVVRTGSFRLPLPVGDYCLWSFFGCEGQVNVSAGEWQFQVLSVPLP